MKQAFGWPGAIMLVTLLAAFTTATVAKEMYRWVDADGNVHYSDTPPPADARETTSIKGGSRADLNEDSEGKSETESYAEQEAEFQERQTKRTEAEAEAKKEAEIAENRTKNCDIARHNLEVLTNPPGGRLRETNADGVVVYVPEEERQLQKAQAAEDVKEWCKS